MTSDEMIEALGEALTKAVAHLDYCGYGDALESDCAYDNGLDTELDAMVIKYNAWAMVKHNDDI